MLRPSKYFVKDTQLTNCFIVWKSFEMSCFHYRTNRWWTFISLKHQWSLKNNKFDSKHITYMHGESFNYIFFRFILQSSSRPWWFLIPFFNWQWRTSHQTKNILWSYFVFSSVYPLFLSAVKVKEAGAISCSYTSEALDLLEIKTRRWYCKGESFRLHLQSCRLLLALFNFKWK